MWEQFGVDVLGGLIESGINAGFDELARARNFEYHEKAADNADKRQRAQFHDLYSYSAQKKQMEEAGLSPSLMFANGASGQGGATAPQGGGASGVQGGHVTLDPMSQAEIDALREQTRGQKIENDMKQESIEADIALKLSQAGLNKASESYKRVQTEREQILKEIDVATTEDQINEIRNRANNMYWESWLTQYESRSAYVRAQVDEATMQTHIQTETAKYQQLLTDIKVGQSQVQLNSATIDKMALEIGIAAFKANTERMSYHAQKKWFEDQIKNQIEKMKQDKELTEEQQRLMNQGQWLDFATDIFGSICNGAFTLGAAALKVK